MGNPDVGGYTSAVLGVSSASTSLAHRGSSPKKHGLQLKVSAC